MKSVEGLSLSKSNSVTLNKAGKAGVGSAAKAKVKRIQLENILKDGRSDTSKSKLLGSGGSTSQLAGMPTLDLEELRNNPFIDTADLMMTSKVTAPLGGGGHTWSNPNVAVSVNPSTSAVSTNNVTNGTSNATDQLNQQQLITSNDGNLSHDTYSHSDGGSGSVVSANAKPTKATNQEVISAVPNAVTSRTTIASRPLRIFKNLT
ncbi:hypothetical protein RFI_04265, partial [Reticulomyxa filosa]